MNNILIVLLSLLCISANAQNCNNNNHSVNINDSWISCAVATNPNPLRAASHWVLYDLGANYTLTSSHFWNYNVVGMTHQGVQNYHIDYSEDGITWTTLGTVHTLPEASGTADYTGIVGPNFGAATARYILLTLLDNHDAADNTCIGISEVRFDVAGVPCFDNLIHPTLAIIDAGVVDYESSSTIVSNALIQSGASVDYDATMCIEMQAGFEVQQGAVFEAFIDGCNSGAGGVNASDEVMKN